MGRPERLYPLGKYRLRIPKEYDKTKPILLNWSILGTGRLYVRQPMSLLRRLAGIRMVIKDGERLELVNVSSI